MSRAHEDPLPPSVSRLLWDTDPHSVDLEHHRDYVMERVMSRGGWEAMQWLRERYPQSVLADFLRRRGHRLPPRERAYWGLVAGIDVDATPGGGRPAWAGP